MPFFTAVGGEGGASAFLAGGGTDRRTDETKSIATNHCLHQLRHLRLDHENEPQSEETQLPEALESTFLTTLLTTTAPSIIVLCDTATNLFSQQGTTSAQTSRFQPKPFTRNRPILWSLGGMFRLVSRKPLRPSCSLWVSTARTSFSELIPQTTTLHVPDPDAKLESFYRRELPSTLVPFGSEPGRQMFREAISDGTMESYFPLSEQFVTQSEPAFCAVGGSGYCHDLGRFLHLPCV